MPESNTTAATSSSLTMNELANARENLATIDMALHQIKLLLQEKESLEAEVKALRREKLMLRQEVNELRCDDDEIPADSRRTCRSLPDLGYHDDDSSSSLDSSDSDDDDEELTNSERKARAPQRFVCPLTLEIMKYPMLQKGTKNNYERGAILEWIYFGKATCPLTRKKLHPGDFVENKVLQREIDQWRNKHGLDKDDEDDESDHELDSSKLVPTLTAEEEREQQKRLSVVQVKRNGSHNNLLSLRDRVLRKRDARARRMSQR